MSDQPTQSRFGEPVELPWWTLPLGLPILAALVTGAVVSAPLSGRLLMVIASALMLVVLLRVAMRVRSTSMQSVYISAALAIWAFCVLVWAVERFGG